MNKSFIRQAVICGNRTPRLKFRKYFKDEIDQFIQVVYEVDKLYETIRIKDKGDQRKAYVKGYLYKGMDDLVSAFNIFISGYIVPYGNLMRHFHESVAMAILFSNSKLDYFDRFMKNQRKFEVNKVFKYVEDSLPYFNNIEPAGWRSFVRIKNFFHAFSHSTFLSLSTKLVMDGEAKENLLIFGSYFDKGKILQYKKAINQMISAADCLKNIILGIKEELKSI
ncbi:MAG: hypothetical protein ACYSSI_05025 [Planctomycetota bacterium]|jgi:hypothetical protein